MKPRNIAALIGALILMLPGLLIGEMIARGLLHQKLTLFQEIGLGAVTVGIIIVGVRKVGWWKVFGWTLTLCVGGSAVLIVSFIVMAFVGGR